jgi:hypothetical protein
MIKNPVLDRPRLYVDFNEMLEPDLVLLSQKDVEMDSSGQRIHLYEGLRVFVYDLDQDENRKEDNLVADGIVVKNTHDGWSKHVKWCCRINDNGIRCLSDLNSD